MTDLVPVDEKKSRFIWKNYVFDAIVSGLVVILPLGIILLVLQFILGIAATLLQPLTSLIGFSAEDRGLLLGLFSTAMLLVLLFLIGVSVSSGQGKRKFLLVEQRIFHKIPFYGTLRDSIKAFVKREKAPFSEVVLIDCYGTGALMTGLVTDEHPSGIITVFVPTAPNPANGCVYHVPRHLVTYLNCSVEQAMHTVVAVGVGSSEILNLRRLTDEEHALMVDPDV